MPAIKSAISVGLLYVPVSLQKTTRDTSIHFNQLCKDSHQRIKYQKYCPSCDKEVKNEDIVKGYEFEKGQYVTISEDELEIIMWFQSLEEKRRMNYCGRHCLAKSRLQ